MLRVIKKKDKLNFFDFSQKNNLNFYLFNEFVKQKQLAFISVEKDIIQGLLYLEKKDNDKYLHIITNSKKIADNLLKILFWHYRKEMYAEIEKKNKLGFLLKENHFRIINKTESIFLLHYNPVEKGKKYGKRSYKRYNYTDKRVN